MFSWNDHTTKVYFASALLSISCLVYGFHAGHFLFNALIIPSLLIGLFQKFKKEEKTFSPLLLVALFFGFVGDLLFAINSNVLFFKTIALSSFTVGQMAYFLLLIQGSPLKSYFQVPLGKRIPELISLMALYASINNVFPNLGDFATQSLIYALISYLAFLASLNRRFFVVPTSFRLVTIGFLLLWISDLLSGFDLLMQNKLNSSLSILSFSLGNFFLVNGILIQSETENKKKEAPKKDASINRFRFQ